MNTDPGTKKLCLLFITASGQPINPQHIMPWDYFLSLSAIHVECQLNIGNYFIALSRRTGLA